MVEQPPQKLMGRERDGLAGLGGEGDGLVEEFGLTFEFAFITIEFRLAPGQSADATNLTFRTSKVSAARSPATLTS